MMAFFYHPQLRYNISMFLEQDVEKKPEETPTIIR